jgi:hypothetical protein
VAVQSLLPGHTRTETDSWSRTNNSKSSGGGFVTGLRVADPSTVGITFISLSHARRAYRVLDGYFSTYSQLLASKQNAFNAKDQEMHGMCCVV